MVKLLKSIRRKINEYVFRLKHGFWPIEWYNFFAVHSEFVIPRLKYLQEHTIGVPGFFLHNCELNKIDLSAGNDLELWRETIGTMVRAFELLGKDSWERTQTELDEIELGFSNFKTYYLDLWD